MCAHIHPCARLKVIKVRIYDLVVPDLVEMLGCAGRVEVWPSVETLDRGVIHVMGLVTRR